jgi:hypothetical protein
VNEPTVFPETAGVDPYFLDRSVLAAYPSRNAVGRIALEPPRERIVYDIPVDVKARDEAADVLSSRV